MECRLQGRSMSHDTAAGHRLGARPWGTVGSAAPPDSKGKAPFTGRVRSASTPLTLVPRLFPALSAKGTTAPPAAFVPDPGRDPVTSEAGAERRGPGPRAAEECCVYTRALTPPRASWPGEQATLQPWAKSGSWHLPQVHERRKARNYFHKPTWTQHGEAGMRKTHETTFYN